MEVKPCRWLTIAFAQKAEELPLLADFDRIHVRMPDLTEADMDVLLSAIPEDTLSRIVLHNHHALALKHRVHGVHINSHNPKAPEGVAAVSRACHSLDELKAHTDNYEYLTLSPIFDSISKRGYKSAFVPEDISDNLPAGKTIALGGVRPDDFFRLRRVGFAGAALMGYLTTATGNCDLPHINRALLYGRLVNAFPLLLITDAPDVDTTISQAVAAYAGGCRWVQVRMKEGDTQQRADAASEIMRRCPDMFVSIDDDAAAVKLAGAHGLHLGKNDISTAMARTIVGEDVIIGRTANTATDALAIAREGAADYFGIGPMRYTTTKKNLAPTLGTDGYRRIIRELREADIHIPVIAIGGITCDDVSELFEAGVDGIAVSGAINRAAIPEEAAKLFTTATSTAISK